MSDFLKRNLQFIAMLLAWVATGWVSIPAGIGVVALSVIILKRKELYPEMIIGFIFILMLSDSRKYQLDFAKSVKDIYLIMLTVFYLFDRKQFNFKNIMMIAFLPFIIWSLAMTFRGPDMMVAFQKTLSYGLLYFIIPAYFFKSFQVKGPVFLKDFILLTALMMIIGLLLIAVSPDFVFLAGRYCGLFGNPNGMGLFSVLLLMLVVCTTIKFPDLFTKNQLRLVFSLIAVSAILSGSRNALMCIFIFLLFTRFYKISYWYGFMAVIVAILLYQVVFSNLPTILEALGLAKALRAENLESGSGRIVAWLFALGEINKNLYTFLLGGGFSYDEYLYLINRRALSALGHQGGVHNTFLALWLNTGIIGLTLWLTGLFRTVVKAIAVSYTALPFIYTVLFSAFFEAWLMGSLNPYHITMLLIFAVIITDTKDFAAEATDINVQNNKIMTT